MTGLIWDGKYDEQRRKALTRIALPFPDRRGHNPPATAGVRDAVAAQFCPKRLWRSDPRLGIIPPVP